MAYPHKKEKGPNHADVTDALVELEWSLLDLKLAHKRAEINVEIARKEKAIQDEKEFWSYREKLIKEQDKRRVIKTKRENRSPTTDDVIGLNENSDRMLFEADLAPRNFHCNNAKIKREWENFGKPCHKKKRPYSSRIYAITSFFSYIPLIFSFLLGTIKIYLFAFAAIILKYIIMIIGYILIGALAYFIFLNL